MLFPHVFGPLAGDVQQLSCSFIAITLNIMTASCTLKNAFGIDEFMWDPEGPRLHAVTTLQAGLNRFQSSINFVLSGV